MDNYVPKYNWIPLIYSNDSNHNLEHFIIPNATTPKIIWINENHRHTISLDKSFAKSNKKRTINYLIIDKSLNESLENFDIVTKISKIKCWYKGQNKTIPMHINIHISHIESLVEYQDLCNHKTNNTPPDTIDSDYQKFLDSYFSSDNETKLINSLKSQFIKSFQN